MKCACVRSFHGLGFDVPGGNLPVLLWMFASDQFELFALYGLACCLVQSVPSRP